MKVWKDRYGKWISPKEFGSRFKQGMKGVTPVQQTFTQLLGMPLIFAGIFWGIGVTFFVSEMKWLTLILLGSLVMASVQLLSLLKKYWAYKEVERKKREAGLNV